MKLELVTRKDVSYVELQKDEKYFLGIYIRDGTQDEERPVLKSIRQKSPAAKSFAIAKNDIILSVNGYSTIGTRSNDIRRMLKNSEQTLNLQLQYKTQETRILGSTVYRKQQMTTRLQKVNGSFGFVLRKKDSRYSFSTEYPVVSTIEGSQIYKRCSLQDGDHLLMIDGISLSWLSLPSIASLLQEKDEAEVTFEYNVGVIDFAEEEARLDLEIDVPVEDLGISICTCSEDCTVMHIGSIRQASVAERCGVFSEGDVILSINDIDVKALTVSEADFLLRNTKKSRKISFITSRRKEEIIETPHEYSSCSTLGETITTENCCSSTSADWKHLNTPASSNFALSVHQKCNFQRFCYSEQIKSMDKFQSMVSIMSSLKQSLSTLTREAFEGKENMSNQNCTYCNKTQHTIKLCTSCLARMNVKCAQSMDVLRNIVAHFVRLSTNGVCENENQSPSVSVRNVIHILMETLPNILRVPELQECFAILAEKIGSADTSCNTCDSEVKSVMIIVQQLLLVLSIRDNSVEFIDLIEHLVSCLLEIKFTCDGESDYMQYVPNECNTSLSENLSASVSVRTHDEFSLQSNFSNIRNNSEAESNEIDNSTGSNLNIPQLKTSANHDYLKFTHIKSLSESHNSISANTLSESIAHSAPLIENRLSSLEENTLDNSSASVTSEHLRGTNVKKVRKNIGLKLAKVWRSLDSFIKPRRPAIVQNIAGNVCHPTPDQCKTTDTSEVNPAIPSTSVKNLQNHLSPNYSVMPNGDAISDRNDGSTPCSSRYPSENGRSTEIKKIRTDTMKVKMANNGDGFGLGISLSEDPASAIPVINSIQPKSPSEKAGILKIGDRILAINHKRTSNLTPKQLLCLKKSAFAADTITLIVEFDVIEQEYVFGTFDVALQKTLKIGLVFEDMKKGYPMVVSGIAKGSAAHRCGQLFPGDQVKLLRFIRNEEFDPVSCSYFKEEDVIITVQRDPREVPRIQEQSACSSPFYTNPCFHHQDSVPRKGLNFVVKSTAVRSLEDTDVLVLEHEVTLFRDSLTFDFGILVGENPDTGRAYITDVRPDGPAHKSGVIKKLDRIVEVNGVSVDRNVENSILDLLSRADHKVDLLIRRIYHEDLNGI